MLLAALHITDPTSHTTPDDPTPNAGTTFQQLPAITAVFLAEAAVALLHSKHFLYRPIDKLLKRSPTLNVQVGVCWCIASMGILMSCDKACKS